MHKNLPDVLKAAHAHRGASFVEIFQNCVVYNDDVFASFTERDVAADKQLWLKAGEKMLFAGGTKGIALDRRAAAPEGRRGRRSGRSSIHDPKNRGDRAHADRDARRLPDGARRHLRRPAPDLRKRGRSSRTQAAAKGKTADLQALVSKGQTWMVEKEPHKL